MTAAEISREIGVEKRTLATYSNTRLALHGFRRVAKGRYSRVAAGVMARSTPVPTKPSMAKPAQTKRPGGPAARLATNDITVLRRMKMSEEILVKREQRELRMQELFRRWMDRVAEAIRPAFAASRVRIEAMDLPVEVLAKLNANHVRTVAELVAIMCNLFPDAVRPDALGRDMTADEVQAGMDQ